MARSNSEDPEGAARLLTIQELSRASGVSVPSIKFYLREGLLAPGDPARPGRAYYDETHEERLRLVRALRDVAGLPVAVIRRVLAAVDARSADSVDVIAPAIDALAGPRARGDAVLRAARAEVDALFGDAGLEVRPEAGSRETIAKTVAALRRMNAPITMDAIAAWLEALRPAARQEIESEETRRMLLSDKPRALELAIMGTVLFEPILIALRRALHEHFTVRLVRGVRRSSPRRRGSP